jgi:hypothetical protein
MSFMGLFPTKREKRLARDEASYAVEKHGAEAGDILTKKVQQTHSSERRRIYKLALAEVRKIRQ